MRNPLEIPPTLATPPPPATPTRMALAGHPIHPMMVTFPVAYLLGGFATDIAFWWTRDPFWARASLWLIGAGALMGILASLIGMLEFLWVKEIRTHVSSWSHFLAAVMLLAIAAANWQLRIDDPVVALLPWGMFLSVITALAVGFAAWLGGDLVFEYRVGIGIEEDEEPSERLTDNEHDNIRN
ncbi:DUF2231 domain-containing protein [Nitrosococcus wardiae]|uniref:DUF2231 domain-containing protein n=1 Tax=Nitrosococcus wardiae TaxID=1814290 RepID=A0A4V1AW81_9GAMM|nr:DUF2231 domain-containing protein [Nitrosococcus wardiae]QBQ55715.1 DUF2231 domain-containing protein [Nitrosococcus wardiae]